VARAATPAVHVGGPRATSDATNSICKNVSTSSVSSIVGYTVPAFTQASISFVVDKAMGLSATATNCTSTLLTLRNMFSSKVVSLGYETFSKPVTLSLLEEAMAQEQQKLAAQEKVRNFKISCAKYSGLGVTAVFCKWSMSLNMPVTVTMPKGMSTKLAYEGIGTVQGAKSYEAAVSNNTLPESKLGALARLAMRL
jgi:hypothetical protein